MFLRALPAVLLASIIGFGAVPARAQDDLPPAVRFDVLRLELVNAVHDGNARQVLVIAEQMRKIGGKMPPETPFYEARAFYSLGALAMARRSLASYLKETGRKGADYQEAIHLYVKIKAQQDEKARAVKAASGLRTAWETAHQAWLADKAETAAWKKRAVVFGGPGEDSATSMARAPQGGIVVAGALYVRKKEDDKELNVTLPWITAFDANGRRIWHRPLGGPTDAGSLRSVVPVPGRGYLFGGLQKGVQMVAVTDRLGNEVADGEGDPWIIGFAAAPHGEGGIARLLPGGDIIALGAVEIGKDEKTGQATARLPVAVRLAPDGKVRGKEVFGQTAGTLWFDVQDALVLKDGDVVVAGETRRSAGDADSAEGYLLRIAPNGKARWLKRFPSRSGRGMALTALAPAPDGGVIAVGRDGNALAYMHVDGSGDAVWRKRQPPHDGPIAGTAELCDAADPAAALAAAYKGKPPSEASRAVAGDLGAVRAFACRKGHAFGAGTAVTARDGGGYLVLGVAGRSGETATRISLTAIGEDGTVSWQRLLGDDGASMATAALTTADGGFVVAGVATNWGRDVALFKTDGAGRLVPFQGLAPRVTARPKPAAPVASRKEDVVNAPPPVPEAGKSPPEADKEKKAMSDGAEKPAAGAASGHEQPPAAGKPASNVATKAPGKETDDTPDILDLLGGIFGASPNTSPTSGRPQ